MNENIFEYALKILKDRENAHGEAADKTESYVTKQCALSTAATYHNAWWIVWYAAHGDWEALQQYDYYGEES